MSAFPHGDYIINATAAYIAENPGSFASAFQAPTLTDAAEEIGGRKPASSGGPFRGLLVEGATNDGLGICCMYDLWCNKKHRYLQDVVVRTRLWYFTYRTIVDIRLINKLRDEWQGEGRYQNDKHGVKQPDFNYWCSGNLISRPLPLPWSEVAFSITAACNVYDLGIADSSGLWEQTWHQANDPQDPGRKIWEKDQAIRHTGNPTEQPNDPPPGMKPIAYVTNTITGTVSVDASGAVTPTLDPDKQPQPVAYKQCAP
ncbi:MAG: hypothetical protein ABSE73_03005 [Planctomycetota bacterium]